MRIKVHFSILAPVSVPINQNYFLASAIYKTLNSRPDYARFLHDHGYIHEQSGRHFKLFTFSPLLCQLRKIRGEEIILGPGDVSWIISSPMEEFAYSLAEGLLSQGEISIRNVILPIDRVESEPSIKFTSDMCFTCLSPIVLTRESGKSEYAQFLDHTAPDFSERIRKNLIKKYQIIYDHLPENDKFEMVFDSAYISKHQNRVTKLIDVRGIKIKGVMAPFRTKGAVELMKISYEVGTGEKNSMGFGCCVPKD